MWPHFLSSALGIWLMSASWFLGYDNPAQTNDRIIGPLVAAFGIIAIWQVTRGVRSVNVILGTWLVLAPWILGYAVKAGLNSMISGALIIMLSLIRGKIDKSFGGGWRTLIGLPPAHQCKK